MNSRYKLHLGSPGEVLPKGVKYILVITFVAFILQILPGIGPILFDMRYNAAGRFFGLGPLVPAAVFHKGQIWRLLTYVFLHGGPFHLLFNMLALWMFGMEIERIWGTRRFVLFYLISGVGSGLLCFFMSAHVPIVGASGAVLGIMTVYAFYYPNRKVLMFFIFPMPVWLAVALIGFISIAMARTTAGNVAHLIHLGGIAVAIIYLFSYSSIIRWFYRKKEMKLERQMRKNAEKTIQKERYFEEVVDPILKKISQSGMDSISKEELKILKEASAKERERFLRQKIIPLDLFK